MILVICQASDNKYFISYHTDCPPYEVSPRNLWSFGLIVEANGKVAPESRYEWIPKFQRRQAIQIVKKYFAKEKLFEVYREGNYPSPRVMKKLR